APPSGAAVPAHLPKFHPALCPRAVRRRIAVPEPALRLAHGRRSNCAPGVTRARLSPRRRRRRRAPAPDPPRPGGRRPRGPVRFRSGSFAWYPGRLSGPARGRLLALTITQEMGYSDWLESAFPFASSRKDHGRKCREAPVDRISHVSAAGAVGRGTLLERCRC